MKQLSILEISIYLIFLWLSLSLITSIYSLYKVQKEINKLNTQIEKYRIGYIIYTSRTTSFNK
ncbi:MAG: hypothetical protein ABIL49_00565 [candidate division WOR-3 bacterium]|jgi:cell division protein FtsL